MLQTFATLALALQQPAGGRPAWLPLLITYGGIILIFWFLLIRPQRRAQQRHMELINSVKKGDEVITDGGIIGQVVHLTEDRVTIRTAENTRITLIRAKIARVVQPETKQES